MTITESKTLAVRRVDISGNKRKLYTPAVQIYLDDGDVREVVITNTRGTYVLIYEMRGGYWAHPSEANPLDSPRVLEIERGALVYDWEHRGNTMFLLGRLYPQ